MAILKLCSELLPNAIGLSDAFGFTDWELDRYVTSTDVFLDAQVEFSLNFHLLPAHLEFLMVRYMKRYGNAHKPNLLIKAKYLWRTKCDSLIC